SGAQAETCHLPLQGRARSGQDPTIRLIAEDVEKVNPDLVVRDDNGNVTTVRYEAVNAMLLNEFLKQHRKAEEQNRRLHDQEATITQLKTGMEAVVAHLEEQD